MHSIYAAYEYFLTAYKDIFDHCFPEKVAKSKNRLTPNNEWISLGFLRSCNKRSLLYKKCRHSGAPLEKDKYIQ